MQDSDKQRIEEIRANVNFVSAQTGQDVYGFKKSDVVLLLQKLDEQTAKIERHEDRIIDLEESYQEASRIAHRQLNRVIPLEKEIEELKKIRAIPLIKTESEKDDEISVLKQEIERIRTYCTLTFGFSHPEIKICPHEQEISALKGQADSLLDYAVHDKECIWSQFREGRPTKDGGYETLYGYGKKEKWYPRNEEPICTCGLNEIFKSVENYRSGK